MGALQACVFLLVVLVVKAEEEPFLGQREVTFDLSDLEDADFIHEPALQKPVTFSPIPFSELEEDRLKQKEVLPDMFHTVALRPPAFGPRAMGPPQVQFPLARPKPYNIQDICRYSKQRPRYPKEALPRTGFSYLVRQADAVNRLESWFSMCCSHGTENVELLLCCAEQAWKNSLSAFCDEEFRVKTSHYHCCKKKGKLEKRNCFEKAAPNQSYLPSSQGLWADIPSVTGDFSFNPRQCQKQRSTALQQIAPRAITGKVTGGLKNYFPPGLPNSGNIEMICASRNERRYFFSTCLPRKGYSLLANQVKAINELEKAFNQCCKQKKGNQACAEKKWKKMVDDFCVNVNQADKKQFGCCEKNGRKEQYKCFAAAAPNPDYTLTNESLSVLQARPTLDKFCDMYLTYHMTQRARSDIVFDKFGDKLYEQCCHELKEAIPACLHTQLDNVVGEVCEDRFISSTTWCTENPEERSKSITKWTLQKLANGLDYSGRKKCPTIF